MVSKHYWKDIRQSFSNSKGRVVSIVSLMALGSFALIGLKATAPNIRTTGEHFLREHQVADLFVISDYGLAQSDQSLLNQLEDATIEYGYFKDVVVAGSTTSFRIFSTPQTLSTYTVVEGALPSQPDEIALSAAYQESCRLGDTITFDETTSSNRSVLTKQTFTITGFINSSELLSRINLGQSTAGSEELNGYAVVPESTFHSDVYMIARVAYEELSTLSPYEEPYLTTIYKHKTALQERLVDQPSTRLAEIKESFQEQIQEGYSKIEEAEEELANAQRQLSDTQTQITDGEHQLLLGEQEIQAAQTQLETAAPQLADGKATLHSLHTQLLDATSQLASGWKQLEATKSQLESAAENIVLFEQELTAKKEALDTADAQLTTAEQTIAHTEAALSAAKAELDVKTSELAQANKQLQQASEVIETLQKSLDSKKESLRAQMDQLQANGIDPNTVEDITNAQVAIAQKEVELASIISHYEEKQSDYLQAEQLLLQKTAEYESSVQQLASAKATVTTNREQYYIGFARYQESLELLSTHQVAYQENVSHYTTAYQTLVTKQQEVDSGWESYHLALETLYGKEAAYQDGRLALEEAKHTFISKAQELAQAKATLESKQREYESKKAEADSEIAEKKEDLKEAQETLDQLALPTYAVSTRREVPGSEGYVSYENTAAIIDAVGTIFPIFLYFIAALVTFTTMMRFVDEERLKAGIFRALGYDNRDILRKFVLHGTITGLVGTAIGTLLGHLLLPSIIYSTYGNKLVLAPLELHFYPFKTFLAVLLSLLSTVFPAILVALRELAEKPAQLLLPKPPVAGEKILMERISPLWSRMNFTQKVTARNIFRYKQRMMMTIFGVCGSIALLFTGLGVRSSIADLSQRQFTDIIQYDMIVATKEYVSIEEEAALNQQLENEQIARSMPVHYEKVTKVAGSKNDEQSITLLTADSQQNEEFQHYIHLIDRISQENLSLSLNGAILSEKLATLLGVKVGDVVTVQNSNHRDISMQVAGITEMYMGHFIFMSDATYEETFGEKPKTNAHILLLNDNAQNLTQQIASEFMALDAVKGVLQNTLMKHQIEIIVHSLNRVMYILIITSVLLAIVILYNLTNINVAERMRELSTIKVLGFYNKEVTMYIYRESIYLSLIGILVGFVIGLGLHRYMLDVIPPDFILFNPAVNFSIYLIPAVIILFILAVLGVVVHQWLKKVEMLEALKSAE